MCFDENVLDGDCFEIYTFKRIYHTDRRVWKPGQALQFFNDTDH